MGLNAVLGGAMYKVTYQVTAPHFCAGFFVQDGYCIGAAPIIRWAIGKTERYLIGYFEYKGYKVELVNAAS